MAYIDTPDGYTFDEAIASRMGPAGEFSNLDDGQKLLFLRFLVANPDYMETPPPGFTGTNEKYLTVPMSPYMAGLRAKVDVEEGWHCSASNRRIIGVEGLDVDLTFNLGDENCEVNMLNAKGIVTAVNLNGIKEWGNYSTGFPGNTGVDAFECVRRTRAIMKRAIEAACVQFLDRNIRPAHIDLVRNTVQQYLNGLVGQDKILYGKCFYRPEHNPPAQLSTGHVQFDNEFTPAIPMQRMTFTYKFDLEQLTNLK